MSITHSGDTRVHPVKRKPCPCRPSWFYWHVTMSQNPGPPAGGTQYSWRFRVPEGQGIEFHDQHLGPQRFVAGRDFGDFVVWRPDDVPAYQLACVADDAAMGITEVVRGADLLVSTARQLLLYRALKLPPPAFFHCDLLADETGRRLAKRHDSLSLRTLRQRGQTPALLRQLQIASPNAK